MKKIPFYSLALSALLSTTVCALTASALPISRAVDDDPNATGNGILLDGNDVVIGPKYTEGVNGPEFSCLVGVNLPRLSDTPPYGAATVTKAGFTSVQFKYETNPSFGQPGVDSRILIVVQTNDGHYQVGGNSTAFNTLSAGNPLATTPFVSWNYRTPGTGSALWSGKPAFASTTVVGAAVVYHGDTSTGNTAFGSFQINGTGPAITFTRSLIVNAEVDSQFNFGG